MDIIKVEGLVVQTIIGTIDWERQIKQKLVVDIEIEHDISAAAENDELEKTINYAAVAEEVTMFLESNQFKLIETAAEKTAQMIKKDFGIKRVRLHLHKPGAVSNAKDVSVAIER